MGDPPKEVRLPSNPYLNLASVMPGVVLQGEHTNTDLKEGMHLYLLQLYVHHLCYSSLRTFACLAKAHVFALGLYLVKCSVRPTKWNCFLG